MSGLTVCLQAALTVAFAFVRCCLLGQIQLAELRRYVVRDPKFGGPESAESILLLFEKLGRGKKKLSNRSVPKMVRDEAEVAAAAEQPAVKSVEVTHMDRRIEAAFAGLDASGLGSIDAKELAAAFVATENLGEFEAASRAHDLIRVIDEDHNKSVSACVRVDCVFASCVDGCFRVCSLLFARSDSARGVQALCGERPKIRGS